MLNNKADIVENYIRSRLAEKQEGWIELSRTELADKISCAPSQISYVLSTRFTHDKGFIVESRRGLGGYIRITIVDSAELEKKFIYSDMISKIGERTPFVVIDSMLELLKKQKFITKREAEIVSQTVFNFYQSENEEKMSAAERAKLTRSIFVTLANID